MFYRTLRGGLRPEISFIFAILFTFALLFLGEVLFFNAVYEKAVADPPVGYDLVLMYCGSGKADRAVELGLRGKAPVFVSGDSHEVPGNRKELSASLPYWVDSRPQTTDQNARDSAPFIRERGFRRVLLLTRWDHCPRALFLTELYLWGSGVEIIPCTNVPVPPRWWTYPLARQQLIKFWGSLGRIVLHAFGVDDWPPPEWMPGQWNSPSPQRKES